ncbi:hypothetical protein [Peribacillus simplex]|uniref:hypothetical protein n=1 Tax=Peribacillus simplex TaxID=1478 RepID=UPI0009711909|nr:hypothetical protein [Peribacillus simplex]
MYNFTRIIFKTSILHFKFHAKMKYNKEMLQKRTFKEGSSPSSIGFVKRDEDEGFQACLTLMPVIPVYIRTAYIQGDF